MAIGTAEGIVADAQVLSGHTDDKTRNKDNLDRVEDILVLLNIGKDTLYYIGDSALFSEENLRKAADKSLKLITRLPDHVTEARTLLEMAVANVDALKPLNLTNANGETVPPIGCAAKPSITKASPFPAASVIHLPKGSRTKRPCGKSGQRTGRTGKKAEGLHQTQLCLRRRRPAGNDETYQRPLQTEISPGTVRHQRSPQTKTRPTLSRKGTSIGVPSDPHSHSQKMSPPFRPVSSGSVPLYSSAMTHA